MLRTRPFEGDTLFQVDCTLAAPIGDHPAGPRHCATFAKSFLEAIHLARGQFGEEHAQEITVETVYAKARSWDGAVVETHYFPERRLVEIASASFEDLFPSVDAEAVG